MVMPDVSVALCTHNGARFVAEQVSSILEQSIPPREIVLSDDASTDGTVDLVRSTVDRFLSGNPQADVDLVVLKNAVPLGVTANFEQAIAACGSELIALCDQDDVWRPDRLARAVTHFQERPALLLLHGDARLIDDGGSELRGSLFDALEITHGIRAAIHAGGGFDVLMRRNVVTGATVLMRRGLAERARPFPDSWVHDEWLAIVAAATGELDVTTDSLIEYRQHGSNQIGVRALSLAGKFRRMVEPGFERNRRLLERARSLAERFEDLEGVIPARREAARQNLEHEIVRSSLKPGRPSRIGTVLRELGTGRYRRFGRGVADAVRDLLQPLKPAS